LYISNSCNIVLREDGKERVVRAMKLKAASLRPLNEEKNDLESVASHLLGKKALNEDKSVPEVLEGKPVLIIGAQGDPVPIRVRKTSRDLPFF
jgi:hypothetical protein